MNKLDPEIDLNFDVSKIKWAPFVMNHAYGIKKYILNEETYMPSMGYIDARRLLYNPKVNTWLRSIGQSSTNPPYYKKVATFEETKSIVFGTEWVKREISLLV